MKGDPPQADGILLLRSQFLGALASWREMHLFT